MNLYPNQTVHSDLIRRKFSIRINPWPIQNQSKLTIRMKPNFSESFGLILIHRIESLNWSNSLDSFGLKVRINTDSIGLKSLIDSDWIVSFGLKLWIQSDSWLIFNGFGIDSDWKLTLGLDRNETVWCRYKFRNDSENFGLVRIDWIAWTHLDWKFGLLLIHSD